MELMKFNFFNTQTLIALIALPLAGLLLHSKIHPEITYLTWILLFDIIIISLLYIFDKTRFYGFILNTTFFVVGVIMHITFLENPAWTDILISMADFSLGYILWIQNKVYGVEKSVKIKEKGNSLNKIPNPPENKKIKKIVQKPTKNISKNPMEKNIKKNELISS